MTDGAQSGDGSITISYSQTDDPEPPTDNPAVTGTLGNNGWYTSDVTVDWNWTDSGLGVDASNCMQSSGSSGEGASVPVSSSCHDLAGNSASDSMTFAIDKSAPTLTCDSPAKVMPIGISGAALVASVEDSISGPLASSVSAPADTSSVGVKTASLNGEDVAGNSTTAGCPYTVAYGFDGFASPSPGSTLPRSRPFIGAMFALTDATGNRMTPATAAALAAAGKVEATLTGPGINPQTAQCAWNKNGKNFVCPMNTPAGLRTGTGNAYTITAKEDLGGGFVRAPAVGPDANPETVHFK